MRTPGVLKFGGSTFPDYDAYGLIAEALAGRVHDEERHFAVVVSAMPGETGRLRERLTTVNPHPEDASIAGLLTLADTVSAHLLASALHRRGMTATVLAGHQQGLRTDATFARARLAHLDPGPLRQALAAHQIVLVPGGQAADEQGRPTWLGKNSSDLSAVLVAAAVGADTCEIHSDVDGVYSADPNQVTGTRLLREVTYDTAALLSAHGAKVLHARSVKAAKQYGITLVCRVNRPPFRTGTVIGPEGAPVAGVVLNERSRVLAFATAEEADKAHSVFRSEGVETVRLEGGAHIAVIGGYLDLEGFLDQHGLPRPQLLGIPVTQIQGSQVTTHIAEDAAAARQLAQRLHDDQY